MTDHFRIATAQLNPIVGDVTGNLEMARRARAEAEAGGADLIAFPELFLLGYPPEDLVLRPAVEKACRDALETLAGEPGPAVLIGTPWAQEGQLYNAVALIDDGEIQGVRFKRELPNYAVFDEKRVFDSGPLPEPVIWRGISIGLPICEDIWIQSVPRTLKGHGAELFISINGSPWRRTIEADRKAAFSRWTEIAVPLIFVNQVGGQDELVFDGASFSWDAQGQEVQRFPAFEECLAFADWDKRDGSWTCATSQAAPIVTGLNADWAAMRLALADYVNKNGFPGVVLGMSGGIDSAISAAIAVDALGADRVWAVMMPSKYTSQDSLDDARECAELLGIRYDVIDVEPAIAAFGAMLEPVFEGKEPDATEENIQSRVRGVTLMALSNKFGPMVLSTGNKSEMAVGYATLYGDMNGGYNALKDIYKTEVYALARWRNEQGRVIPERIITKAPSAELKPDQTDQDSLPDYAVLDAILTGLVESDTAPDTLVEQGFDADLVAKIENMLYRTEYKRRQAPPGVKIGKKNFGRDRRYPITNKFRASRK